MASDPSSPRPSPSGSPHDGGNGGSSGRERRQFPRAAGDWPLTIRLTAGNHAGQHSARVRDLSRAGVCFYMEHPVELMTVLEIALELPVNGQPDGAGNGVRHVRGTGAVVRCEPISAGLAHFEVAVFIQHMAEDDRAAIAAHISGAAG